MKLNNLTGRRFGYLTVLQLAEIRKTPKGASKAYWFCKCDCGNTKEINSTHLLNSNTRSCGCYRKRVSGRRAISMSTHGMTKSREYRSWNSAKERCFNPKCWWYDRYGGKGITMCKEWKDNFETFYRDMGPRPIGTTLDRYPNKNGNYEPGNCRWATPKQQASNRKKR